MPGYRCTQAGVEDGSQPCGWGTCCAIRRRLVATVNPQWRGTKSTGSVYHPVPLSHGKSSYPGAKNFDAVIWGAFSSQKRTVRCYQPRGPAGGRVTPAFHFVHRGVTRPGTGVDGTGNSRIALAITVNSITLHPVGGHESTGVQRIGSASRSLPLVAWPPSRWLPWRRSGSPCRRRASHPGNRPTTASWSGAHPGSGHGRYRRPAHCFAPCGPAGARWRLD